MFNPNVREMEEGLPESADETRADQACAAPVGSSVQHPAQERGEHLPVPAAEAVHLYRQMVMIREFEEQAAHGFTRNRIGGYFHTCIGQEASVLGIVSALTLQDYMIASYREHGHALARGCPPREVMAELYGRASGSSSGKGGSMHIFDSSRHFLGGTGIVGGNIPIAAGVALGLKYLCSEAVCACFFGDGAVNEGTFHEALNMAALWRLPVLFVCENNLYGMGTHVSRANAVPEMTERAAGYGMERYKCDGMDLFEVRSVADELLDRIRETKRPIFLESLTYRFLGHGSHDPGKYRTQEEVAEWKERDPIKLAEELLVAKGLLTADDMANARADAVETVRDAVQFAEVSPLPDPSELTTDVVG